MAHDVGGEAIAEPKRVMSVACGPLHAQTRASQCQSEMQAVWRLEDGHVRSDVESRTVAVA
jgi:hypothetical protein